MQLVKSTTTFTKEKDDAEEEKEEKMMEKWNQSTFFDGATAKCWTTLCQLSFKNSIDSAPNEACHMGKTSNGHNAVMCVYAEGTKTETFPNQKKK